MSLVVVNVTLVHVNLAQDTTNNNIIKYFGK